MNVFSVQTQRTQITIFVIAIIVGFLLVTQWQGQKVTTNALKTQTEQDLGQIVRQLTTENDVLQTEVSKLQLKLLDYQRKAADKKAILHEAQENLQNLKIVSSLLPIQGPGLKIGVTDGKNILNTPDFLELIQELKVAGAEGISINNKRFNTKTYFKKKKRSIFVNGKRISSPYIVKAIGNPEILYQAVTLAGGIKDRLNSLEGVTLKATKQRNLVLPTAK